MSYLFFSLLLIIFPYIHLAEQSIYPDESILTLTDDNFETILSTNNILFMEFYVTWCSHCKMYYSQFEQTMNTFKQNNDTSITFAKANIDTVPTLNKRFKISRYPSYILIFNHSSHTFSTFQGPYIDTDFIFWLNKKTKHPLNYITDLQTLKNITSNPVIPSIAYITTTDKYDLSKINIPTNANPTNSPLHLFTNYSYYEDNFRFHFCVLSSNEIEQEFNVKVNSNEDALFILKPYDEKFVSYVFDPLVNESLTIVKLDLFILNNVYKHVQQFDETSRDIVFARHKPGLFLIRDPANLTNHIYETEMSKVANNVYEKLQTVISGLMNRDEPRLIDFLGIYLEDTPCVFILDTRNRGFKKYKMNSDIPITAENVMKFIKDWEEGKLVENIKSEAIPDDKLDNEVVKKVVGKTLRDVIENDSENRVIEFYSYHCEYCMKFESIYMKVAKMFKEKVKMYKIDIEKNDIGNVSVKMTPTVKMWLKGSKTEINFDYKSEITEEMFIKFIKDNMSNNDINNNDKVQNINEEDL